VGNPEPTPDSPKVVYTCDGATCLQCGEILRRGPVHTTDGTLLTPEGPDFDSDFCGSCRSGEDMVMIIDVEIKTRERDAEGRIEMDADGFDPIERRYPEYAQIKAFVFHSYNVTEMTIPIWNRFVGWFRSLYGMDFGQFVTVPRKVMIECLKQYSLNNGKVVPGLIPPLPVQDPRVIAGMPVAEHNLTYYDTESAHDISERWSERQLPAPDRTDVIDVTIDE
jgi:hypothetical protein